MVAARFRLPIAAYVLDGQGLHLPEFRPSSLPTVDADCDYFIVGYSPVPGKPARTHVSQDEGDSGEDADRTLLSTPPRDAHAHTHILSPSARSKSASASIDPAAQDCPEIDLRALLPRSRRTGGSTRPHRDFAAPLRIQHQHDEADEFHEEKTLVHRWVHIDIDSGRAYTRM